MFTAKNVELLIFQGDKKRKGVGVGGTNSRKEAEGALGGKLQTDSGESSSIMSVYPALSGQGHCMAAT